MASTTLTAPRPGLENLPAKAEPRLGGPGGGNGSGRGGGGDGSRGPDPAAMAVQRYTLGVWVSFGGIIMIFAALTSAMVVRAGLGEDWKSFGLPTVLWFSTALLLVSSFTIEKAKRALRARAEADLKKWLTATALLGSAFLASQWAGWMDLGRAGPLFGRQPKPFILLCVHRWPWTPLVWRSDCYRVRDRVCLARPYVGHPRRRGGSRRSLLALHGRSLGLFIRSVTRLEVNACPTDTPT